MEKIKPYRDVIIFVITLLVANCVWKLMFPADEATPFEGASAHVAKVVYGLLTLFRDTVYMVGDRTIRFESGSGTTIIGGCTGIKQSFIWLCLMLTVVSNAPELRAKTWLHKLWYIPVGWVCCYMFNIARIFCIALIIEHHFDLFHLMHDYIFKYAFYAMLFGLWVIFVEKIRPRA